MDAKQALSVLEETSDVRAELVRRIAYFIGRMPVLGHQLFKGDPIIECDLFKLRQEDLLDIYEHAVQAYWRSVLVEDESYRMEPAPIDSIRRESVLAALANLKSIKVKLASAEPENYVSLRQALELVQAMPSSHRKVVNKVNLHDENAQRRNKENVSIPVNPDVSRGSESYGSSASTKE